MKKALDSISWVIRNRYVLLGVRLVLGATFILGAAGKLPEQAKFVDVVTGLGLLPWDLARAYGSVLPWLELAVGICLVAGLLSRVAAGASILMIISFIVANRTAVFEYEFCPCFGDLILLKTSDALIVDVVMTAMILLILLYGGGFLSLGPLIWAKLKRSAFPHSGLAKGPR